MDPPESRHGERKTEVQDRSEAWRIARNFAVDAQFFVKRGLQTWIWVRISPASMARRAASSHGTPGRPRPRKSCDS